MTMNQDQIKANMLSITFWVRLLFMAGYALALWVVWIVLIVTCIAQTFIVLITGTVNDNLQKLGVHAAAYMNQIIRFMIFATEDKPFPFNAFPNNADDEDSAVVGTVVPATTAPVTTGAAAAPSAEVVDDDDQSDSYYDPERDSGATR